MWMILPVVLALPVLRGERFQSLHLGVFMENCDKYQGPIEDLLSYIPTIQEAIAITPYRVPCKRLDYVPEYVCSAIGNGSNSLVAWANHSMSYVFQSTFNTLAPHTPETRETKAEVSLQPLSVVGELITAAVTSWKWHYIYVYADYAYRKMIPRCIALEDGGLCHLVKFFAVHKYSIDHVLDFVRTHSADIAYRNFFVACNENITVEMLNKAHALGMLNGMFVWFLFNPGTERVMESLGNILRIDSKVYLVRPKKNDSSVGVLLQFLTKYPLGMATTIKSLVPEKVQEYCKRFPIKNIENVKLVVNSNYSDPELVIIKVFANRNGNRTPKLIKRAVWKRSTGIRVIDKYRHSFRGAHIRIATLHTPPYIIINKNNAQKFSGYLYDLLQMMAVNLNFSYELTEVSDNQFGTLLDDGTWTGVIGAVSRNAVDLGLANLSATKERIKAVQFLRIPIANGGLQLLYKKPLAFDNDNYLAIYSKPFDSLTWTAVILMFVLVSFCLCAMNEILAMIYQKTPRQPTPSKTISFGNREFRIRNCLFVALQAGVLQGFSETPSNVPIRIPFLSLWFFSLVLYSSYSATLTSFFTVADNSLPFTSLEGYLSQSEYISGLIKGTAYIQLLNSSTRSDYRQLLNQYVEDPSRFVNNYEEGFSRVDKEKFVFLHDPQTMKWMAAQRCNIVTVGPIYLKTMVTLVVPHGSELATAIGDQLQTLHENGFIKRLQKKWWPRAKDCESAKTFRPVPILNVYAPVLILAGGLSVSGLIIAVEYIGHRFYCYRKVTRSNSLTTTTKVDTNQTSYQPKTVAWVVSQDKTPMLLWISRISHLKSPQT